MGCNVCKFNNEKFIENEFKYAYNNQIDEDNKETEENKKDKENNKINENDDNANKNITNELDDNKKENEKKIISDELLKSNKINQKITEIQPEKKEINNDSLSTPRSDKKSNNIKINNKNNQNKEETKDETNKKIIISEQLKQINNNTPVISEIKNQEKINLFQINEKPNNVNTKNTKEKNDISISSVISSLYKNDYNTRMVDLINKLRTNPKEYAKIILSNIQYIQKRVKITADDITGQNEEKEEIFFQKKIKVELYRGEIAFFETAEFLNKLKPLKELKVKEEIKMNLLPETEDQILNDKILIKNQLDEIKKRFNISAFFKDNLRNPEIGLMLMIIGDNKNSQNKKRNALLNPDYKYIAVNSKFIGDKFVSYFTFSK
jgi:hypothetical protein